MGVNLRSVFFCSQAVVPFMPEGGSIINVTSLTSVIGISHLAAYGASKGGVTQMAKSLAVEWAPLKIRVNCIAPGRIRTPMTEALFADEEIRESFVRLIPMGHGGEPEDVGGAVVYLAADASSYVTGQTLIVDGGWLASGGSPLR